MLEKKLEEVLAKYFPKSIYSSVDDFLKRQSFGVVVVWGENVGEGKVRRVLQITDSSGGIKTYSATYRRSGPGFQKIEKEEVYNPKFF